MRTQRNPNALKNLKRGGITKDNQPSPENKAAGWKKKRRGQELAKAVLELAFKGMTNTELKAMAAAYFGVPQNRITVEMMMLFRQAEKAIQKADTPAFRAVMERAHGAPKQDVDIKSGGKTLNTRATIIVQDEETRQALLNIKPKPKA